jgi:Restriction endonuclease XhoI
MSLLDIEARFQEAVQHFWNTRAIQQLRQSESGKTDAGTRGAVTGGAQMAEIERLVVDILEQTGLNRLHIRTRTELELPGYYRPEKKWDLLVVSNDQLVTALEFKSQVGPSFGNNFNNRVEEAVGSATDIWTAYREGRFGMSPRPFLGYFFLLEDCAKVHRPVKNEEPYFKVDPVFKNASYSQRYEYLCRRLVLERVYDAASLTLATNEPKTRISHPATDVSFRRFVAELQGNAYRFVQSQQ